MNIENRRDYELFLTTKIKEFPISNEFKRIVKQLAMDSFDDGFAVRRDGRIVVDINKEFKPR